MRRDRIAYGVGLVTYFVASVLLQPVGQHLSPRWPTTTTTVLALPVAVAVGLAVRYLPRPRPPGHRTGLNTPPLTGISDVPPADVPQRDAHRDKADRMAVGAYPCARCGSAPGRQFVPERDPSGDGPAVRRRATQGVRRTRSRGFVRWLKHPMM